MTAEYNLDEIVEDEPQIYVVLLKAGRTKKINLSIVSQVLGYADSSVMMVTFSQPAPYLSDYYAKNGVDMERVTFIDTITKFAGGSIPEDMDNATFLNTPGDLTGLGIILTETLKKVQKDNFFVVFDSINAMLIYLDSGKVSRFLHFMTSKLRLQGLSGVIMAVERGLDPILMTQLESFADEILDLTEAPSSVSKISELRQKTQNIKDSDE